MSFLLPKQLLLSFICCPFHSLCLVEYIHYQYKYTTLCIIHLSAIFSILPHHNKYCKYYIFMYKMYYLDSHYFSVYILYNIISLDYCIACISNLLHFLLFARFIAHVDFNSINFVIIMFSINSPCLVCIQNNYNVVYRIPEYTLQLNCWHTFLFLYLNALGKVWSQNGLLLINKIYFKPYFLNIVLLKYSN